MSEPMHAEDDELASLVGQAANEYTDRVNRGEKVDTEDYVKRYPQIADVLRQMLPSLELIGGLDLRPIEPACASVAAGTAPQHLGDYNIVREIGRGGMGVVYEAEQKSLARRVALKVLPFHRLMDPLYLKRFRREAQAAARLHHTNIVPVFGVGEEEGTHFYAMQFIDGRGLDQVINELRALRRTSETRRAADDGREPHSSPAQASAGQDIASLCVQSFSQYCRAVARIGVQVAEALAYAHLQGILHRDIKPSNLLLDATGTVWITDFGLAKADSTEDLTHTGDLVGTLRYAAPERLSSKSDARSDIFSLGLTLYELLVLRPAHAEVDQGRLIQQVANANPPRLRKLDRRIPADLETIVQKAIANEPERRYQTALALAEDLRRYLDDRAILARRTTWFEQTRRWCRRNPVVAALIAIVALMTLTIAIGSTVTAGRLSTGLARAEHAEDNANRRLYDSLSAQARASRWSGKAGQRFDSLRALAEAAQLIGPLDLGPEAVMGLRDQAIACLALTDASPRQPWELLPPDNTNMIVFDKRLEHCARYGQQGELAVWRTGQQTAVARLTIPYRRADGLAMSPDGRYVVIRQGAPYSREQPYNVAVWDWSRTAELTSPSDRVAPRAMDFTSQSDQLIAGLENGDIVFYKLPSCLESKRLTGNSRPSALAVDSKGKRVAFNSPGNPDVVVRDVDTGMVLGRFRHAAYINCLAWHPDGDLVAAACHDGHIYVWNVGSGRRQATLPSVLSSAIRMSFSSNGNLLMTWSWDGAVRLWNPWTGQQLVTCPGLSAYLSDDGRQLVSRQGAKFALWDVAPGLEYQTLPNPAAPGGEPLYYAGPCLSRDRRWLIVACGDGIRIWDLHARRLASFLPVGRVNFAFHAPDKAFFTFGPAGLYRWPFDPDQAVVRVGPPERLAPGGEQNVNISFDRQARILARRTSGGINLFDMANLAAKPRLLRDPGAGQTLSPDGAWLVGIPWNTDGVKIWDTRTGACVKDLLPYVLVARATFSPEGDVLVIQTAADYQFWKVGDWRLERRVGRETDSDNPGPIVWSPDGSLLAIAISSRQVQLLEKKSGRLVATLEPPNADQVNWMEFGEDGRQLIVVTSSPGCVRVWDLGAIREQLAAIGLDWDLSPYPPARPKPSQPVRLQIDLGELAPKAPIKASRRNVP